MVRDIREFEDLDILEEVIEVGWESLQPPDNVSLEEIIIVGEYGRGVPREIEQNLRIALVINVEGEDTSGTELFEEAQQALQILNDDDPPIEFQATFGDLEFVLIPDDDFESAINLLVPERQGDPNRAYSLTRDENILVEDVITREPAGVREIEDIDDLSAVNLRNEVVRGFETALNNLELEGEDVEGTALDRILVRQRDLGRVPEDVIVMTNRPVDGLEEKMADILSPEYNIISSVTGVDIGNLVDIVVDEGERRTSVDLADLINNQVLTVVEGDIPGTFDPEITDAQIIEEPETEPEPEIEEPEPEPTPELPPEPEEEEEPEFEHLPPELRQFGVDDRNIVRIPIGKDTKEVEQREPYDFEEEMYTGGRAETGAVGDFVGTIGDASNKEAIGTEGLDGVFFNPSSFPRVGKYIKNHLLNRGPSYILDMYRDIVIYSGYISTIHEGRYVIGSYESFRQYIFRLNKVHEEGGPELIRRLSQQEAASRGLDTVPELPSGQAAPWLERKQYYVIVEENMNHQAWENVSAWLYGD